MNKPQYLEPPKATDAAACNWQSGQAFRVMKMDVSDLHSAWYVVMPGGGCLTFNNCADDAQDEAQANWVAHTLNAELASMATGPASEAQAGWVMVPREPTLEMGWAYLEAACKSSPLIEHAFNHPGYRAMLASAPRPASSPVAAEGQKPTPSGELSDASRLSLLNTLAQHRGFENATKALASIPLAAEGQKAVERVCSNCRYAALEARAVPCVDCGTRAAYDRWEPIATPTASMADAAEAAQHPICGVCGGMHAIGTFCRPPRFGATPGPRGENAVGVVEAWQPIETAPKDGTRFLAVCGTGQTRLVRWADYGGDRYPIGDSPGTIWDDHPTHWMPLPPAPDRGLRIAEKGDAS